MNRKPIVEVYLHLREKIDRDFDRELTRPDRNRIQFKDA